MPHVRIETSVRHHRKFLEIDPAACWLWACGLMYCQDTLTDGFIPSAALEMLGVKGATKAMRLAHELVNAGLWEPTDGGWRVHDYLDFNKTGDEVKSLRAARKRAASKGGLAAHGIQAKGEHDAQANAEHFARASLEAKEKSVLDPYVLGVVPVVASAVVELEGGLEETNGPVDGWFEELASAYPPSAVTRNYKAMHAFSVIVAPGGRRVFRGVFDKMLANLASQKTGAQWSKGMIPHLDRWLSDGLWQQEHKPAAAVQANSRDPQWVLDARARRDAKHAG